jgi:ferredoxin-NADP reductase/predicted pyridoxine 5'-phosphate oxidase superfamily flavin-nucleotide-binding protein
MPMQHQTFFSNLEYFFIGSLDEQGRPWASVITGKSGFIQATDRNHLRVITHPIIGDPLVHNLSRGEKHQGTLVAGLGIDFSNRRRNKVAGRILENDFSFDEKQNTLKLNIKTEESLGNCPKYITVRKIRQVDAKAKKTLQDLNTRELPEQVLPTIEQASTIMVASKHGHEKMGLNHRGGPQGFVRYSNGKIYWPDYSGNRLYQTLGNIATDPVAGLLFPDFETGNVLYVTGEARTIIGQEAAAIMPNTNVITQVQVTGYVFVEGGMTLRSEESLVQYSPYNPTVSYLLTEKNRHVTELPSTIATLKKIRKITPTISTFEFETSNKVSYQPGQHVIIDFSSIIEKQYRHMNDSDPQSLNDNLLRSWTITSPPTENSFELTIRKQHGMSRLLHELNTNIKFKVRLRGIGGNFSYDGSDALFIAAGIGITPFVAFLKQANIGKVALLLSIRKEDENLRTLYDNNVEEHVFVTDQSGRIGLEDIKKVENYNTRQWYVCGPTPFMKQVISWAQQLGVEKVFSEEFNF